LSTPQILKDLLGAVTTITIARFGFAAASLWRTADPNRLPLIQVCGSIVATNE
jgi:hypothetical protein